MFNLVLEGFPELFDHKGWKLDVVTLVIRSQNLLQGPSKNVLGHQSLQIDILELGMDEGGKGIKLLGLVVDRRGCVVLKERDQKERDKGDKSIDLFIVPDTIHL